jgi:hypothetical protein
MFYSLLSGCTALLLVGCCTLQVIVINLPIMVEDPHHAANIRARKFSTALAQLVQQKYPSVSLVDFQSACRQHMAQHSTAWQQALQETPGNRYDC